MFGFHRSREPLTEPTAQTTAQYLCRLMEEQNLLLREVVLTFTGRPAATPRAGQPSARPTTPRTDKDVSRVTRETVRSQRLQDAEKVDAPWRMPASGPDSGSTSLNPGTKAPDVGSAQPPPKTT